MKLTKILITLLVTFIAIMAVSCVTKSYAEIDAFDMTAEMWDAAQNDQPANLKGTIPVQTITYQTEIVSASAEQVFTAAFEVLGAIDPEEVPQIMRGQETGKALIPMSLKLVKKVGDKGFDNTKRGELLATYKTRKLLFGDADLGNSLQSTEKRARVLVLPQSDGTVKLGTWTGQSITAYTAADLLSQIKAKL